MPFIDTVKRINVEDFPEEGREIVSRIAETYNFFAEQVTNTLNGNVDITNLDRNIIELTVSVNSNGIPTQAIQFTGEVGLRGTKVLRADNLTNNVNYPTSGPFVSFTPSGTGLYTIDHITGLVANNQFRLVLELVF